MASSSAPPNSPSKPPSPAKSSSTTPDDQNPLAIEPIIDTSEALGAALPGDKGHEIDVDNPPENLKTVGEVFGVKDIPRWSIRSMGFSPGFESHTPREIPFMGEPHNLESEGELSESSSDEGKGKRAQTAKRKATPDSPVKTTPTTKRRRYIVPNESSSESEEGGADQFRIEPRLKGKEVDSSSNLEPGMEEDLIRSRNPSPQHCAHVEEEMEEDVEHMPLNALLKMSKEKGSMFPIEVPFVDDGSEESEEEVEEEIGDEVSDDDSEESDEPYKYGREELDLLKEDAREDVITPKAKPQKKKATPSAKSLPMSRRTTRSSASKSNVSTSVPNPVNEERLKFFMGKSFVVERKRDGVFDEMNVTRFLREKSLLHTVDYPKPFYPRVVSEFYAGLSQSIKDSRSDLFECVWVRGKRVSFSPKIINAFLKTPNPESIPPMAEKNTLFSLLSNGLGPIWHKQYPVTKLTALHGFLFKVACFNWKPSSNAHTVTIPHADLLYRIVSNVEFNLGEVVFNSIVQYAEKELPFDLVFPCLISAICLEQGVELSSLDKTNGEIEGFKIKPILNSVNRTIDLPVKYDDEQSTIPDIGEEELLNMSAGVSTPPPTPVNALDVICEEINFLEKSMLEQRVKFREMVERRNRLIDARNFLSGQKGGEGSSSQVFQDISHPNFEWNVLEKTDGATQAGGGSDGAGVGDNANAEV